MSVINLLPRLSSAGQDLTYVLLQKGGRESGAQEFTYTTSAKYDYVIAWVYRTNGTPDVTCSKGTLVKTFQRTAAGGSNQMGHTARIWKDVESGAVITFPSYTNRRGYIFIGANAS